MSSQIETVILLIIEQHGGTVEGTEHLATDLLQCHNRAWVRELLGRIEQAGDIQIIRSRGGRGCKTIYKRNRNQPGQPRRHHA